VTHGGGHGGSFSELNTGLDLIGFTAASRDELEQWERHFEQHGVVFTPSADIAAFITEKGDAGLIPGSWFED